MARRAVRVNYHEYLFVVLLFSALTALLAISYGWQTVAASTVFAIVGLLMVAIRGENTWPRG